MVGNGRVFVCNGSTNYFRGLFNAKGNSNFSFFKYNHRFPTLFSPAHANLSLVTRTIFLVLVLLALLCSLVHRGKSIK